MPRACRLPMWGLVSLALTLTVTGCPAAVPVGAAAGPAEKTVRNGLKPQVATVEVGDLTGRVAAPGIISTGGGNVIATGGGNIIAAGGGNIIASGGGNYRALAAPDEDLPVDGAIVVLRDARTQRLIPQVPPTRTDATGAFRFSKVPARINFLVEVLFITPDKRPFRMLKLAKAGAEAQAVTWASTAVTGAMMAKAGGAAGLYMLDDRAVADAEAMMAEAARKMEADGRTAMMRRAIAVAIADGEASLTVDDALGSGAMEGPRAAAEAIRVTDDRVGGAMDRLSDATREAPSTADQTYLDAAQEALDGAREDSRTAPTPTPAAATPAPTPTPPALPASWNPTFVKTGLTQLAYMTATSDGVAMADLTSGGFLTRIDTSRAVTVALGGRTPAIAKLADWDSLAFRGLAELGDSLYTLERGTGAVMQLSADGTKEIGVSAGESGDPLGLVASKGNLWVVTSKGVLSTVSGNKAAMAVEAASPLQVAVAPDGSRLLVVAGAAPSELVAYDARGASVWKTQLSSPITGLATDGANVVVTCAREAGVFAGAIGARSAPAQVAKLDSPGAVAFHPKFGWIVQTGVDLAVYPH